MDLIVTRSDLRRNYLNISFGGIKFNHFKGKVQAAIFSVGQAIFNSERNGKFIRPPIRKSVRGKHG